MSVTLPRGIDHLAIATDDMKATLEFYCGAIGLPLSGLFWMHGVEGAVHAFCPFGDGRMLSFIQFAEPVLPREPGRTYSTWAGCPMPAGAMQHVALQVDDLAQLAEVRERLKAHGVKVTKPMEHGFCTSIYFEGPDNVQLEITCPVRAMDEREFDPEVVAHCGIGADDLARFKAGAAAVPVSATTGGA